jgi:DNA primase
MAPIWPPCGPDRRNAAAGAARVARAGASRRRRIGAGLADQPLRLLLRHNEWWEQLSGEDLGLLHELGGAHGDALAWLERQITEHGLQTLAALDQALAGEDWAELARGWLRTVAEDEEHGFEDLQRVLQRLWIEALGDDAQALASAEPDAQGLARLRQLRARIAGLKAALTGPTGPTGPTTPTTPTTPTAPTDNSPSSGEGKVGSAVEVGLISRPSAGAGSARPWAAPAPASARTHALRAPTAVSVLGIILGCPKSQA